jgi:hypothetical protein
MWLALLLLSLGVLPARAQPGATYYAYLPFLTQTGHIYLPMLARPGDFPRDLVANPSFENENWDTDAFGNQQPVGWSYYVPGSGQVMPFPTKRQGSTTVPALSGGVGENVHKPFNLLPYDEWVGAPRAIIVDGLFTYKSFSDHIPFALRLRQTLTYTPGAWVKVTGYILGETQIFKCSGTGVLEDDHFIGSVQLGSATDTRFYSVMRQQHDVPGNERAWNKFSVTSQVPASGQLVLTVIMQSNWACPVDFFIDHFQAYETPPP